MTLAEFCEGVSHWSNQLALSPERSKSTRYLETLVASVWLSKVLRSVLICRLTLRTVERNRGTDKSAPQVWAVPLACSVAKLPTKL